MDTAAALLFVGLVFGCGTGDGILAAKEPIVLTEDSRLTSQPVVSHSWDPSIYGGVSTRRRFIPRERTRRSPYVDYEESSLEIGRRFVSAASDPSSGLPGFSAPIGVAAGAHSVPSELTFDGAGFLLPETHTTARDTAAKPESTRAKKPLGVRARYPGAPYHRGPTVSRGRPRQKVHTVTGAYNTSAVSHSHPPGMVEGTVMLVAPEGTSFLPGPTPPPKRDTVKSALLDSTASIPTRGKRPVTMVTLNPREKLSDVTKSQFVNLPPYASASSQPHFILHGPEDAQYQLQRSRGGAPPPKYVFLRDPATGHQPQSTVVIEAFGSPHPRSASFRRKRDANFSPVGAPQAYGTRLKKQEPQPSPHSPGSQASSTSPEETEFIPITGPFGDADIPFHLFREHVTPRSRGRFRPLHQSEGHHYSVQPHQEGRYYGGSQGPYFYASEARRHGYGILGSGNFEVLRGGILPDDEIGGHGQYGGNGYDSSYGEIAVDGPLLGFQGFDNFHAQLFNALSKRTSVSAPPPPRRRHSASQLIPSSVRMLAMA